MLNYYICFFLFCQMFFYVFGEALCFFKKQLPKAVFKKNTEVVLFALILVYNKNFVFWCCRLLFYFEFYIIKAKEQSRKNVIGLNSREEGNGGEEMEFFCRSILFSSYSFCGLIYLDNMRLEQNLQNNAQKEVHIIALSDASQE